MSEMTEYEFDMHDAEEVFREKCKAYSEKHFTHKQWVENRDVCIEAYLKDTKSDIFKNLDNDIKGNIIKHLTDNTRNHKILMWELKRNCDLMNQGRNNEIDRLNEFFTKVDFEWFNRYWVIYTNVFKDKPSAYCSNDGSWRVPHIHRRLQVWNGDSDDSDFEPELITADEWAVRCKWL